MHLNFFTRLPHYFAFAAFVCACNDSACHSCTMQLTPQIFSCPSHTQNGPNTLQSCYTNWFPCQELPGDERRANLLVTDLNKDIHNISQHHGKRKMPIADVHESEISKKKKKEVIYLYIYQI